MNSYLDSLSSKPVGSHPSNNDSVQARESSKKMRADSERLASELHDLKNSITSLRTKMKNRNKSSRPIEEDDSPKKQMLGSNFNVYPESIRLSAPYPVKTNMARTGHNDMKRTEALTARISALGSRLDNFSVRHKISTNTNQTNNRISGNGIKNHTDSESSTTGEILYSKPGFMNPIGGILLQNNTEIVSYYKDGVPTIISSVDSLPFSSVRFIRKGLRDAEYAENYSIHNMNQYGDPSCFSSSNTSICIERFSQSNFDAMNQPAPLVDENFELNSSQYISAASFGLYASIMRTMKHPFFPISSTLEKKSHSLAISDSLGNSFSSRTCLGRNVSVDSSEKVTLRTESLAANRKSLSKNISCAMKQKLEIASSQGNIAATRQYTEAFSEMLDSGLPIRCADGNDTYAEEEYLRSHKPFISSNTDSNLGILNTLLNACIEDLPLTPALASHGVPNLDTSIVKQPSLDNSSNTHEMHAQENRSYIEPAIPCYDGSSEKQRLRSLPRQSKAAVQLTESFSASASSNMHKNHNLSKVKDAKVFFFATPTEDDTSLSGGTSHDQIFEKSPSLPFFLVLPKNDHISEVGLDSEQSINNLQPLLDDSRKTDREYSATSSVLLTKQINISAQNRASHFILKKDIEKFFQRGITSNLKTAITTGLCLFLLACP